MPKTQITKDRIKNFTEGGSGNQLGDAPVFSEILAPAEISYREVIFTGKSFVIVASSGARITRSEDGYVWYTPTAPAITTFGIVQVDDVLIASAETGSGSNCMRSTDDGRTWTQINTSIDAQFRSIDHGRGITVMAATGGVSGRVVRSLDKGLTWTAGTVATELSFLDVVEGGGVFLLIANGAVLQRSTDGGATFSNVTITNRSWSKGIFFQGRFILFAGSGTGTKIAYSNDLGLTWTSIASPQDLVTYTRPAIVGKWLYCGGSGGMLIRSLDGINWESYNSGTANNIQSVVGGRIKGVDVIIMVCDGGTNRFVRAIN
jgi:hypothetical protein